MKVKCLKYIFHFLGFPNLTNFVNELTQTGPRRSAQEGGANITSSLTSTRKPLCFRWEMLCQAGSGEARGNEKKWVDVVTKTVTRWRKGGWRRTGEPIWVSGEHCSRQESDARGSRETSAATGVSIAPTDPTRTQCKTQESRGFPCLARGCVPGTWEDAWSSADTFVEGTDGRTQHVQNIHETPWAAGGAFPEGRCKLGQRCRFGVIRDLVVRGAGAASPTRKETREDIEEEVSELHSNPSRAGKDVGKDLIPSPSNISSKEFSVEWNLPTNNRELFVSWGSTLPCTSVAARTFFHIFSQNLALILLLGTKKENFNFDWKRNCWQSARKKKAYHLRKAELEEPGQDVPESKAGGFYLIAIIPNSEILLQRMVWEEKHVL